MIDTYRCPRCRSRWHTDCYDPDYLNTSEDQAQSRFMLRYLIVIIVLLLGISYAYACSSIEPEPLIIIVSEAI